MAVLMFAAIEVGSYEIEMKIFEIGGKNGIREIDRIAHVVELGKNSYNEKYIGFEMIDEVCDVLYDFCKIMKSYGVSQSRVCATSAVREAENCQTIVDRIYIRTGLKVDVLSNSELRYIYNKAIALKEKDFESIIENGTVLVDMGSGSAQLTLFDQGKLITTQNILLGSLRVREVLAGLSVSGANYRSVLEEYIDDDMEDVRKMFFRDTEISNMIVTGEYVSTLFGNKENVRTYVTKEEFEKQYDILLTSSADELEEKYNIPQEHVGVLIPSSMIYKKVLDITGAQRIWVPNVKLCDGMVAEYAEKNKKIKFSKDFNNDILNASRVIAKRYMWNEEHVRFVEESSLGIFDATRKIHGLGKRERLLLQIAAILHECGKYINVSYPGDCSFSIIMRTEIIGISHMERVMVANIVKYNTENISFESLLMQGIGKNDAMTVIKLAAILRLSNALDKTHKQKCRNMKLKMNEKELIISVNTFEDMTIERGLFPDKTFLFEQAYGIKPVIIVKRT
ncbi:MAG: exopolyphosphatase [Thermoflexaceae bacterium]|nr:exopolyphosphatase [Thermoflexaceae bacterium]